MRDVEQQMRSYETPEAALAAVLRVQLAERQQTVEWLAAKSGIPYGTLRRYYAGKRGADLDAIFKLAAGLSMSGRQLLGEVESRLIPLDASDREASADFAHLPGEVAIKLDKLTERLRTASETQDPGAGSETSSSPGA